MNLAVSVPTTDISAILKARIERSRVVDRPGHMQLINKHELHIDHTYQRDASKYRIAAIATTWSWIACGTIIVAQRDGRYYVVDGGHRVMASRLRPEISDLPCIVFKTDENIEEAKGFLQINKNRRQVHAIDTFRSMVIVGDPTAIRLKHLFDENGYKVSTFSKAGTMGRVGCVGALMFYHKLNPACFDRIWPLVMKLLNGQTIMEKIVGSIFYCEVCSAQAGITITTPPWSDRILRLGPDGVTAACAKASAYYARGGMKVWAKGLVDQLNHGVRHRLEIIDIDIATNEGDS